MAGAPIGRDTAIVETGVSTVIGRGLMVAVSYARQIGDQSQTHGVRGNLNWRFSRGTACLREQAAVPSTMRPGFGKRGGGDFPAASPLCEALHCQRRSDPAIAGDLGLLISIVGMELRRFGLGWPSSTTFTVRSPS